MKLTQLLASNVYSYELINMHLAISVCPEMGNLLTPYQSRRGRGWPD